MAAENDSGHIVPARGRRLSPELVKFVTVGGIGFLTDLGAYDIQRAAFGMAPLLAKFFSVSLSTTVAYLGNRLWTYRERTREQEAAAVTRQYAAFILVTVVGLLIQVLCLWTSHYLLGFRSLLADNVSGSGVGMALATVFRFWGYRTLVFRHGSDGVGAAARDAAAMGAATATATATASASATPATGTAVLAAQDQ